MWPKLFSILVVFFVYGNHQSDGAKILAIVPIPSYSHQIAYRSLFFELSKRGHHITYFTTNPIFDENSTNIKQIDLSELYTINKEHNLAEQISADNLTILQIIQKLIALLEDIIEYTICHPELKEILKRGDQYDLVMFEYILASPLALAYHLNCPTVGVISMDLAWYGHLAMGNAFHPVANPDQNLPYTKNLTFKERLFSTLYSSVFYLTVYLYLRGQQDHLIGKCLGDTPPLAELENNISMAFVNSNPLFHNVRALGPATVNVAGKLHMNEPKPLTEPLQNLLDNAKAGVIYFSLGSNVKSKSLDNSTRRIILEALSELPFTVLWKYEENLAELPENVYINRWYPQQDILRHPNVKLFITQGGLQSLEEAVYNYVPLIGIPFFGDQFYNIKKIVDQGFGLSLDYNNLNKEQFKQAILEVINNPEYKRNVKQMADLSLDQPMTGLEKAVWWTEYVIRNNGAKLFRNPIKDLPFYQYLMLDILSFFMFVIVLLLIIVYIIVKLSIKLLRCLIIGSRRKVKLQ